MSVPRVFFTATFMANHEILIAGGVTDKTSAGHGLSAVEVYDPNANRDFPSPPLAMGRAGHTATLLTSGLVLIVGGYAQLGNAALNNVEVYRPGLGFSAPGSWVSAAPLKHGRTGHAAVLLADGRVLVTGGRSYPEAGTGACGAVPATLPAEIYDPVRDMWTDAATPALDRPVGPTATRLKDGRVLVVGGQYMQDTPDENVERPEIYDAKSNSWSFATPEIRAGARQYHTATVLGDGRILYAGGSRDLRPIPYVTVYDPSSNTWTQVGSMIEPRCGHSAELLPSGDVLAVGGGCGSEPPSGTMEQYSRADNRWYPVASMAVPRANVVTVNLDNGVIFAFGGEQHGVTNTVVEAYYSFF